MERRRSRAQRPTRRWLEKPANYRARTENLCANGLPSNTLRHWTEFKRCIEAVDRFLLYDVWQPLWFGFLSLTRLLRNALGFRSKVL